MDTGIRAEALIDYISTSPENINYNMVREMLNAIAMETNHPYFDYYLVKIDQTDLKPEEPGEPI